MRLALFMTMIMSLAWSGCKTPGTSELEAAKPATGSNATSTSSLAQPTPGTTNNPIPAAAKTEILRAWKQVQQDFYVTQNGYSAKISKMPKASEALSCLSACPDYYSSLTCHYYCWHPSYATVVPNFRGCYSNIARGSVRRTKPARDMFYAEIYDYCLYQPYDVVKGSTPPYDQTTIDTNKAAGKKVGVNTWIDNNEAAAFQYIMFNQYNPFAFAIADQQEIINAFYGVDLKGKNTYTANDAMQIKACNAKRQPIGSEPYDGTHCSYNMDTSGFSKHPKFKSNVQFMTAWIAANQGAGANTPNQPTPQPPASVPLTPSFSLKKGLYKTRKTTNSSCVISIDNIHNNASGELSWFSFTYQGDKSAPCNANGRKMAQGTKVSVKGCGDNECDFMLDPNNPVLLQVKSDETFSIRFPGSIENWKFDQ